MTTAPDGPDRNGPTGQDIAALDLQRGQRVRITFEAEVLRVGQSSGDRGAAVIYTRAGRGMNDAVWIVREPEFGEVVSVEVLSDGLPVCGAPTPFVISGTNVPCTRELHHEGRHRVERGPDVVEWEKYA